GLGNTLAFHVGAQALARIGSLGGLLDPFLEELAGALERGLDVLEPAILQSDRETAERAPRSDIAAHHARTHDVYVIHGRCALAAHLLQSILQQEDAYQIASRLASEQVRNGARLGLVGLLATRAVIGPQIDDGVGRRV